MKKPNAVLHMMGYGLVYTVLVSYILGFILLGFFAENRNEYIEALGYLVWCAFIFGGVAGFLTGWILWFVTRRLQPSPHEDEYVHVWKLALKSVGGFSFVAMASLLIFLFGDLFRFSPSLFPWIVLTILPAFVAAGTAMYAVHRYVLKLWAWANVGKAKNDHKLKNQLSYTDAEDKSPVTTEADSPINTLRL